MIDRELAHNINIEVIDQIDPVLGRQYRNCLQFANSEYGRDRLKKIDDTIKQAKTGMIFELNNNNVEEARQQAALITGLEEAKNILFLQVMYDAEAVSYQGTSAMEDTDE